MKRLVTFAVALLAAFAGAVLADEKPRVLLLGDSISMGYTPFVQQMLADDAVVLRPKENCAGTTKGVQRIEEWLKIDGGNWDVVHFNFGLHDLKRVKPDGKNSNDPDDSRQAEPETYAKQLTEITEKIKATGATVIFATTTPYPAGVKPHRDPADAARYNAIAKKIMEKHGVAIDDLHAFAAPRLKEIQRPVNVHFTSAGSKALAGAVVESVKQALSADTGLQSKESRKPRKQPGPFSWVNPPAKGKFPHVVHGTYRSKIHDADVGYNVLLPPGYQKGENADRRYPVVYYLHGGRPGSESKSLALSNVFHEAMKSGDVPPMIYVFVNGGAVSHYDYPQKKSWGRRTFHEELIPHVDATYRTIGKREGRGLEGFSQGGRGTARHVFARPDLFSSAAPMGGGHQHEKRVSENGGDEGAYQFAEGDNSYDLAREYAKSMKPAVRILVAFGTEDFNYEANLDYCKHLASLGVPFEQKVVEGVPHSATKLYAKVGTMPMTWHAKNFERALGATW